MSVGLLEFTCAFYKSSFDLRKQLYITKNSINLLKEIKSYKWKTDKDGRVMEEPVKFRDDLMDAMRYAIYTKLSKPQNEDIDGNY